MFKCLRVRLQNELFIFSDHLWGRRLLEVLLSLVGESPDSASLKTKIKQEEVKQNKARKILKKTKRVVGGGVPEELKYLQTVWAREKF